MNYSARIGRALARSLLPLSLVLSFARCGSDPVPGSTREVAASPPAETAIPDPPEPTGPVSDLPPNELGRILVLEYHRLGEPEQQWMRSPAGFREDLDRLYAAGYRPITVRQLISGEIDLPRGASPVVFTMDDSSKGQFYFLDDGSIDPETMIGIWGAFKSEHPAWSGGATWCILPAADHPSNFFGEAPSREVPPTVREDRIRRKLEYLVANGHEICNHTLYHARLDRAISDAQVQEWIGRGEDSLKVYLPDDYDITTMALPLGMWPDNRSLAQRGTYKGKPYSYDAILEVAGGPNESPFDKNFDPLSINRVIAAPGAIETQLGRFEANPSNRYVSDGDPATIAVPAELADKVDAQAWPDREIRLIGESPAKEGSLTGEGSGAAEGRPADGLPTDTGNSVGEGE